MAMVEGMEHHSPGPAWLLKELVLAIFLIITRGCRNFLFFLISKPLTKAGMYCCHAEKNTTFTKNMVCVCSKSIFNYIFVIICHKINNKWNGEQRSTL
jgi:hypothetical protein